MVQKAVKEVIWDRLVAHGAPLGTLQPGAVHLSEKTLQGLLDQALDDLKSRPHQPDAIRKQEALESLILALYFHHHSVFLRLPDRIRFLTPDRISGRHIKLKRIASAHLAGYL